MTRAGFALVLALVPIVVSAQVVEPTRIVHGSDIVPRCGSVLNAPTLAPGIYDCVEFEGSLTLPPGVYRITTLLGLPGSVLYANAGTEIIIRDEREKSLRKKRLFMKARKSNAFTSSRTAPPSNTSGRERPTAELRRAARSITVLP